MTIPLCSFENNSFWSWAVAAVGQTIDVDVDYRRIIAADVDDATVTPVIDSVDAYRRFRYSQFADVSPTLRHVQILT